MHDQVITGATIVDGTGGAPYVGDIAITGGLITQIGRVEGAARETFDAAGLIAAPGFVDIHTHYDGQATWDPLLAPSFWHGVTTVVMGNCGVGFAPAAPASREWLIGLMEGVEDIPGSALAEGIDWQWESFPEYLDALASKPHATDVAAQIAHGPVRAYVMGARGARNEAADDGEIARMKAIVGEALAAGAVGFSTSRTILHRAIDGEPVPGTFAAEAELRAFAEAVAESGHGLMEIAPAGVVGEELCAADREVEWMTRLSAETGARMTFLMGQSNAEPTAWRRWIDASIAANQRGAQVTPQTFGRSTGVLITLRTPLHPFAGSATWRSLADLPHEEKIRRLQADPDLRRRVATDDNPNAQEYGGIFAYPWPVWFKLGDPPDYEPDPADSCDAVAKRAGRNPREVALDWMLEGDGEAFMLYALLGYADGDLGPVREMLLNPYAVVGGSDGGAHCGVICDASVPTFLLTHWVRDRTRGPRLLLEFVIKKQTADTARLFGMHDRGVLAPGYRADLNLIDMNRLRISAPKMIHDLPSGAPRLMQTAQGYVATFVAGVAVQRDGVETGARPGRLVRGGRGRLAAAAE